MLRMRQYVAAAMLCTFLFYISDSGGPTAAVPAAALPQVHVDPLPQPTAAVQMTPPPPLPPLPPPPPPPPPPLSAAAAAQVAATARAQEEQKALRLEMQAEQEREAAAMVKAQQVAAAHRKEARDAVMERSNANAIYAAGQTKAVLKAHTDAEMMEREHNDLAFRMAARAKRAAATLGKGCDVHGVTDGAVTCTVVLVIAHNRPEYLQRCLAALVKHHPAPGSVLPLVISEDRAPTASQQGPQQASDVVAEFENRWRAQSHGNRESFLHIVFEGGAGMRGYQRLAHHYKWALTEVFENRNVGRVIIIEEDLEIATDFFDVFAATAPLLDDPAENLLAVSAFNDDGLERFVDATMDAGRLVRSEFFPGLGWMLTRALWEELEPKWPDIYWDDWLRGPDNHKGREVLRPVISRTFHFGAQGTSNNQFGGHLAKILLADETVAIQSNWASFDPEPLRRAVYESRYIDKVRHAKHILLSQMQGDRTTSPLDSKLEFCLSYGYWGLGVDPSEAQQQEFGSYVRVLSLA